MNEKEFILTSILGAIGAIPIAMIILKFAGIITWSWFWVLSPFWIPVALCVLVTILLTLFNNDKQN
jgi:hypothetical protein